MKAVIVNRFGDFGIYFAILIIFFFFKSFDFSVVFTIVHFYSNVYINFLFFCTKTIDLICFFLFIGAIGKSAQIGLHT
jgi:NADH:ubiquinone oxidoreductase subunit 5 (subunit L)/multisubunit Na+/H+ antiporter MnhA subunit